MWNRTGTAVVAVAVAIAGNAFAQATGEAEAGVACEVAGYDVIIVNLGVRPIPAGTSIEWSVPFARARGTLTLTETLDADRPVFLTGALGSSYLDTDTDCQAAAR